MPNHRRHRDKKKVPAALVLAFSILSVGSPLALLFVSPSVSIVPQAEAAQQITLPITSSSTETTTTKKKKKKKITETATTRQQSHTQTTKPAPVSEPTTRPKPTVEQRQVQRSTTATPTPQQRAVSTSATPKPQIPKRTTTATPPITTTTRTTSKTVTPVSTKTTTAPPNSDSPKALAPSHQRLLQVAQKYVGVGIPYQLGGNSLKTGMDCSHFVWMVLKEAGYNTAYRPSDAIAAWVTRTSAPQPGDLVLFQGHVGIFAGNGMMIDQGSSGGAHLRQIKYYDNFIGYGRIPL